MLKKTTLCLAICALCANSHAHDTADTPTVNLDMIKITLSKKNLDSVALTRVAQTTDMVIKKDTLKQRATTLGDALDGELGIHSNQFGGGASAPIIRGQEGKRLTILQNNADVIDMAHLSPDHAVMVDTMLARRTEVVRGVSTLLYKSGNLAGVVNILDDKIPQNRPATPFTGEAGIRYNTGNHEKLATGALTADLGKGFVAHLEGLHKTSNDYRTPNYIQQNFKNRQALDNYVSAPDRLASLEAEYELFKQGKRPHWRDEKHYIRSEQNYLDKKALYQSHLDVQTNQLDYLPQSWADSKVGSIGLSWVHDKGYVGVALSERKDKYGLPAHNHLYEGCGVISTFDAIRTKPYLAKYPQLINTDDINYINPRPDCGKHIHNANGSQQGSHGVIPEHEHIGTPYIDLSTRRYDLRGQWQNPTSFIDSVRFNAGLVDYTHDEKEAGMTNTSFKNKGKVARLEFTHRPTDRFSALWGIQYIKQNNSGLSPQTNWRQLPLLTQNTLNNQSIFGMGQYQWGKVALEFGTRFEKQTVKMDYDLDYIKDRITNHRLVFLKGEALDRAINDAIDATKPHQNHANSYGMGVHWQFLPKHRLSFNATHQERLPNAQELYTHGMHLATNSFEMGNRHLTKEKANSYELGFDFKGDKLDYQLSGYLYDFDNYIYLHTINEYLGTAKVRHPLHLRINHYDQSPAKFYGVEGKIGYQFNDKYYGAIFGDYVKGRLHNLAPIVSRYEPAGFFSKEIKEYTKPNDRYTPRLPPMRLGAKIKTNWGDNWTGEAEYVRTFTQSKTSNFENATQGHHLVNVGLNYKNVIGAGEYSLFFNANNILNQKIYAHETFLPYIPQMGRNFSVGVNFKY
ncbi:TonB-dependent receptor [Moraxella oblonga]|uniref:TonB-dependent receptor n=1 Tax=Moraxella oblonga TaxID=200413 RepID=UPI0008301CF0|nr:TonB-dependent receptor [Moraxella oblonga]